MKKTTTKTKALTAPAKKFPIRPLEDRVIVKRDEAADKTPGGILLPDSVKEKKLNRGVVVRVGPGKPHPQAVTPGNPVGAYGDSTMPVKEGDRIIFGSYAGWELPEYEDYVMMRIDDVLGVLEA